MAEPLFHAGDVVRKWRGRRNWTNQDLADAARVGKDAVTRVERGDAVNTDTLNKIVLALGYTVQEVYAATGAPVTDPDELKLLTVYRQLEPDDRQALLALAAHLRRRMDGFGGG